MHPRPAATGQEHEPAVSQSTPSHCFMTDESSRHEHGSTQHPPADTEKTYNKQDGQFIGWDSKSDSPEYDARVLTTTSRRPKPVISKKA
jgi:hypothetical protein